MRSLVLALGITTVATVGAVAASGAVGQESTFTVEEVRFASGGVELAGRLWLPDGPGPHAAMVFLPGSGRSIRDLDRDPDPVPPHFTRRGIAFLAWDKRGVRDSGGEFEPVPDSDAEAQLARLRLLASDAAAAMRYLATRGDIDGDRIGAWAFSQGGWVAPLLEAVGARPAFVIVVGGPAVTIGEEQRYSEIAHAAREASRAGTERLRMDALYESLQEARAAGADFGGYDPLPYLESLRAPTLFLLGEYDLSVPTRSSVRRLEGLGNRHEWIDYRVFPRANHGVATLDPAGEMYIADEFYETQYEYLANLGIIERSVGLRVVPKQEAP